MLYRVFFSFLAFVFFTFPPPPLRRFRGGRRGRNFRVQGKGWGGGVTPPRAAPRLARPLVAVFGSRWRRRRRPAPLAPGPLVERDVMSERRPMSDARRGRRRRSAASAVGTRRPAAPFAARPSSPAHASAGAAVLLQRVCVCVCVCVCVFVVVRLVRVNESPRRNAKRWQKVAPPVRFGAGPSDRNGGGAAAALGLPPMSASRCLVSVSCRVLFLPPFIVSFYLVLPSFTGFYLVLPGFNSSE